MYRRIPSISSTMPPALKPGGTLTVLSVKFSKGIARQRPRNVQKYRLSPSEES